MNGNDLRRPTMKEKKEEILLNLKREIQKLWENQELSNELMEKIQKKAHELLGNSIKSGDLTKSEALEVGLKGEVHIFSLVGAEVSKCLYNFGEKTKDLLHSNEESDKEKAEKNIKQLLRTKDWLSKTDLDPKKEISYWIDSFLQENYKLS